MKKGIILHLVIYLWVFLLGSSAASAQNFTDSLEFRSVSFGQDLDVCSADTSTVMVIEVKNNYDDTMKVWKISFPNFLPLGIVDSIFVYQGSHLIGVRKAIDTISANFDMNMGQISILPFSVVRWRVVLKTFSNARGNIPPTTVRHVTFSCKRGVTTKGIYLSGMNYTRITPCTRGEIK